MPNNYKIKFSIGDWSGDGHGQHQDFTVISNRSIAELKAIQDSCNVVFGFDLEDLAGELVDGETPTLTEELASKLELGGFTLVPGRHYDDTGIMEIDPYTVLNLWIDILCHLSPGLFLIPVDEIFDGHMTGPGYGAFYL